MKILVTDNIASSGVAVLEKEPGLEVDKLATIDTVSPLVGLEEYDGLLVGDGTQVNAELLERTKQLRVIAKAGVDLQNIDLTAATHRGILVMNNPHSSTIAAAEHTISMLLALARQLPQANTSMHNLKWEKKKFKGVELWQKTLGIIGLGRVGREVAKRACGLGLRVIAADPAVSEDILSGLTVTLVPLPELYRQADFITLHLPLNEQNHHLLNQETLAQVKRGVRIINCAQGGLIDESALYEAIVSGRVAGAALDVFEQEPPAADNPLLQLDNVVTTPKMATATLEAQDTGAVDIAHQMIDFLKRGLVVNAVNTPPLSGQTLTKIKPYLNLAEALGKLMAQLIEGNINEIRLEYQGEILTFYMTIISNYFLKSLFQLFTNDEKINSINARYFVQKHRISLTETVTAEAGDYVNIINVVVATASEAKVATGCILSGKYPRVIMLDGFRLEFSPSGFLLITLNEDHPGLIGSIGNVLGEHKINIAGMQFGRKRIGGEAISVFRVDSGIPTPVLEKIADLPYITAVKLVYL